MNSSGGRHPAVSVVIAAYKAARYVGEAIESALRQTFSDLEIIVVDDGSPDDTARVAAGYLTDPRVRYFWQANSGQCAAKNNGVGLARGEFIAFLDADDRWLPDKLERQLGLFEDRPDVGVVYGFLARVDGAGDPLPWEPMKPHRGQITSALLLENFVPFASTVVRKSLIEKNGGFDARLDMGIDYDLWLRLSLQCEFDYVPEVVGLYRVWEGQMSTKVYERYDAGIYIMRRFVAGHSDAMSAHEIHRAWAHTYAGRGNTYLWTDRRLLRAWADYMRALTHDVSYWPIYRSMLRSLVTWKHP